MNGYLFGMRGVYPYVSCLFILAISFSIYPIRVNPCPVFLFSGFASARRSVQAGRLRSSARFTIRGRCYINNYPVSKLMTSKIKQRGKDGRRWRRRKDKRPGEIRMAALECFGERGFAGTRLDDVAERAGVTKGTLYLYFQNKEDLFKAVVSEELVPNIVRIESLLSEKELPAPEALAQLMRFWVKTFTTTRLSILPKLVISEVGNFPELAEFYIHEVIDRGFALVGGILRRGIDEGDFREINVEETIISVIAPAIVTMLWKHSFEPHGSRKLDPVTLVETHIEIILRGLGRNPAAL